MPFESALLNNAGIAGIDPSPLGSKGYVLLYIQEQYIEMTLHSFVFMQTITKSITGYKPVSSIKSLERTFFGAGGGGTV